MEVQDYIVLIVLILLVSYDVIVYFQNENTNNLSLNDLKKYPQNNLNSYLPISSVDNIKSKSDLLKKRLIHNNLNVLLRKNEYS